mmetsp:Transcript_35560/g.57366  ORF Transcript_35560/g.57366 Transcript_35560/m.57366 type:complete len:146 (-) Transcript_35560:36-473(-)
MRLESWRLDCYFVSPSDSSDRDEMPSAAHIVCHACMRVSHLDACKVGFQMELPCMSCHHDMHTNATMHVTNVEDGSESRMFCFDTCAPVSMASASCCSNTMASLFNFSQARTHAIDERFLWTGACQRLIYRSHGPQRDNRVLNHT